MITHLVLLFSLMLALIFQPSSGHAKNNSTLSPTTVTNFVYESQQLLAPNMIQHYYLTDHFEEGRRVFSLFASVNDELQDLILEKSFAPDQDQLAKQWLQSILKKYQLNSRLEQETKVDERTSVPLTEIKKMTVADTNLWQAENEWNADWELAYGQWVAENLTPNFMVDIQLPTDCADVAYTLRWVFARIHKLPMAAHLGGSSQFFTNESVKKEWLNLPQDSDWKKDRRFRAALIYLLRNTYTHTLMKDSYPLAINSTILTPGTHHLSLHGASGHTMVINSVNSPESLPITLLYSTTPVQVRELFSTFYQVIEAPTLYQSGFYKIRWAKKTQKDWQLLPAQSIPGYSEEQFNLPVDEGETTTPHFLKIFKLLNPNFSFEMLLEKSFYELQDRIRDRIKVVEDGYAYCQSHNCDPGSSGEEDWSTPSRDKRIEQLHESINLAANFLSGINPESYEQWRKKVAHESVVKNFIISGETYSLAQITLALIHHLTQTDPRLPIAQRWGVSLLGYSSNLRATFESALTKRKELIIAAEVCRKSTCPSNSEQYKKYNTVELDKTLLEQWSGAQRLCQIESENICPQLDQLLSSTLFEQKSLLSWVKRSPFWLSNPNLPAEARWGFSGSSLAISGSANVYFSENHQWFTLNHSLYRSSDFFQIPISAPEIVGQLHYKTANYFTYENSENNLTIRFYQPPRNFISNITLKTKPNNPLRIWWSSPTKESLSVFTPDHYYEINLQGQVLKELNLIHFAESPADPRITFIETTDGYFISDAEKDASQFIAISLNEKTFSEFHIVVRTNNGWNFSSLINNRSIYLEPSGLLLDWTIYNNRPFINATGSLAIRTNSTGKVVEIFKREKNKDEPDRFSYWKTIPGEHFFGKGSFLSVYGNNEIEIYSLDSLELIHLECSQVGSFIVILSPNYYSCSGLQTNELREISGPLIASKNNAYSDWSIEQNPSQIWASLNQWSNRMFFSEVFALSKKVLIGPVMQKNTIFGWTDRQPTIEINPQNEVAPAAYHQEDKTNFGLVQSIYSPNSFILYKALKIPQTKDFLFLPNGL
jgi:hypothetical protein